MDSNTTQQIDRTAEAMARLEAGIKGLADSAEWQRYLAMQARFHKYSYSNTLLILAQYPDASKVAGLKAWNGLNRKVVKGERAIWILAPIFPPKAEDGSEQTEAEKADRRPVNFKAVPVFALEQTEGEPLPEPVKLLDGDSAGNLFEKLASFSAGRGVPVTVADFAGEANGFYAPAGNTIVVRESLPPDQACKTLAHEIAHSILHRDLDTYSEHRGDCELEAESVAFIVLSHFGVDSGAYSFGYVTTWAGGDDAALTSLRVAALRITRTARTIIETIEQAIAPVDSSEPVAA